MKLLPARRRRTGAPGAVPAGPARVDRRTQHLLARLKPGEVAVLDALDLDRATAERLVARRPAAVVNASASSSGRRPALGAQVLLAAGVPLVDRAGPAVLAEVADGQRVHLEGGAVVVSGPDGERVVAEGVLATADTVAADADTARAGMVAQLESFTADAADHLRRESPLLLDGAGVPQVRTRIAGRHVLVVAPATTSAELRSLRSYVREHRPVVIGVEDGADAVLAAGHRLDLVLGGQDALSDAVLASGAEVVVHTDRDADPADLTRLRDLSLAPVVFAASGTPEDLALLLAAERGARLVVAAGQRLGLLDLLDRGRSGTASAVLTRLRVSDVLVDAAAVARLHRPRITDGQLLALLLAALVALAAAMTTTPAGQTSAVLLLTWLGDGLTAASHALGLGGP